jgi:hypothetical protein
MGMGWAGITVGQLSDMLPDASKRVERKKSPFADGCGCCPLCHGFVHARFDQPDGLAVCPRCGGRIPALDPLV